MNGRLDYVFKSLLINNRVLKSGIQLAERAITTLISPLETRDIITRSTSRYLHTLHHDKIKTQSIYPLPGKCAWGEETRAKNRFFYPDFLLSDVHSLIDPSFHKYCAYPLRYFMNYLDRSNLTAAYVS